MAEATGSVQAEDADKASAAKRDSVWRNPDFVKLWIGDTLSQFGSQITQFALPLVAIITLQASAVQVGILHALESLPFLFFALHAGVLADRFDKRRILIGADVGRALLLGSVPLAAVAGVLSVEWLYVAGFLVGCLTVVFQISYQAYLPALVPNSQIMQGNSALEFSYSLAQSTGPGMSGPLVKFLTAPIAILLDAISFVLSAIALALIRPRVAPAEEPDGEEPTAPRVGVIQEIKEGLAAVFRNPVLRSIAGAAAIFNLFFGSLMATYTLFMTRTLDMSVVAIGLVFTAVGPGMLLGAMVTPRLSRKVRVGVLVTFAAFLSDGINLLIPLAQDASTATVAMLMIVNFLTGFGMQIFNITSVSIRQVITPIRLLGRVTATIRLLALSLAPIGSVLGGVLGTTVGLRSAILVSAIGLLLAAVWVAFTALGRLRVFPEASAEAGDA